MKAYLRGKLLNLLFGILRLSSKHVLKWQSRIINVLHSRAYLASFDLFPDKKLSQLIDMALVATGDLLGEDRPSIIQSDIRGEDIDMLIITLSADDNIKTLLCNYYRVASFRYYAYGPLGWFDDEVKENLDKAREFDEGAKKLTSVEFSELKKFLKSEDKKLKKDISKRAKERIETHKESFMPKIQITGAALGFVFSFTSMMFLVSGFLYQYFVLGHFGVNVSDFFSITDYIASSTEVILPSVIATVFGLLPALFGLAHRAQKTAIQEQYDIKEKGPSTLDLIMYAIGPTLVFLLFLDYHLNEKVYVEGVTVLVLWGFIIVFVKFNLKNYFNNSAPVSFGLLAIVIFSLKITDRIHSDIKIIEAGEYKNEYQISFTSTYNEFHGYRFVSSNSTYIFLYDADNNRISVIPTSGVRYINISNDPDAIM
ncbi:hypothetical protein MNBD_GAMMA14-2377 [hydrothermal vent metagenome]|uniref:Uncharacterized protein n=1 Tax=hydrothermal vent metagenome TaxID=652676 RepID=A0A3B0XZB2_9ZZZZ